ncbi:MAG: HsdR family type I site-specific deoxyribonuclease [Clostridiales bacterium]|jgi:type I restriction enzyme R subunit|nr:HsdR family type I site-specific deoxyribonuclease [Clostridiales bacterium]
MINEADIEQMIISTIVQNGWKYIPAERLSRSYSDVCVEPMVKNALIRLNPEIAARPDYADIVIYKLRGGILTVTPNDLVWHNEKLKRMLFEENSFPFGENARMIPIHFFDAHDISKNEFVVTNQWIYPKEDGGKRLDIVLLVNGFPWVMGEIKSPARSSVTWMDGAVDISAYEKSIPGMFVPNVFNFATEGKTYRYSSINAPASEWGPWRTPEDKREGTLSDVNRSVADMLKPETVMDLMLHFTLFATDKKYKKYKIICRYQQYEGANKIVERVKAGYPKKGLIWHFQGSGKSLLMVFAAQKLRMTPELKNPTVAIVDDRIDLETQITATFNASDIPNLQVASSSDEIASFFKSDTRKILITTIFKFGDVESALNYRENIILLVDEAHRTQEGNLGEKMRTALPNAFFFGLTGTPINRSDKNTFLTFGAVEDESGYMSHYAFSDSIRDKATLPLHFETVSVELRVSKELVNDAFSTLTEDLSNEEKGELTKRVRIESIIKAPARVRKVCEHIAKHYQEKIAPNGFKGQIVCYDRESCLLYKDALDGLLGESASTVVIDTHNDKEGKYKDYRRDKVSEGKLLDFFRDQNSPLKLVIVTSKLLTGFDAPVLQVMYLDKPMKDHTLLQAICRTNRICGQTKTHGLIVDYIGIFDDVAKALNFDEESVKEAISNIETVKESLPSLMEKCLSYFAGIDRTVTGWEGLAAAQDALPANDLKDAFAADYNALSNAWEILSPDPCLIPFKTDYLWLSQIYESIKPIDSVGGLIWAALGAKTLEIVNSGIEVASIPEANEIIELNAELIDEFFNDEDAEKKLKALEINLNARIKTNDKSFGFVRLGELLEKLKEQHSLGLITSIEFLKSLINLARDVADAENQAVPTPEIDKGKSALTELFNTVKNEKTPIIVESIVNDIDSIVKHVRFAGWQNTTTGIQDVQKQLRSIIWLKYKIKDQEMFDNAYKYIVKYY